jgi:hypothetical protein
MSGRQSVEFISGVLQHSRFSVFHSVRELFSDFCCNLLQIAIYILHIAIGIQETGVPLQATGGSRRFTNRKLTAL